MIAPARHPAARGLVAFAAGVVFAIGLALAGMTQPAKVIGFLDVFGTWDPSLGFVIAGAIAVHATVYWVCIRRRSGPQFSSSFDLPSARGLDRRLLFGAAVFGVGWGLAGFCPGPAIVSVTTGATSVMWFVGAMLVGMMAHGAVARRRRGS